MNFRKGGLKAGSAGNTSVFANFCAHHPGKNFKQILHVPSANKTICVNP